MLEKCFYFKPREYDGEEDGKMGNFSKVEYFLYWLFSEALGSGSILWSPQIYSDCTQVICSGWFFSEDVTEEEDCGRAKERFLLSRAKLQVTQLNVWK